MDPSIIRSRRAIDEMDFEHFSPKLDCILESGFVSRVAAKGFPTLL